jgi:hypothetical protein
MTQAVIASMPFTYTSACCSLCVSACFNEPREGGAAGLRVAVFCIVLLTYGIGMVTQYFQVSCDGGLVERKAVSLFGPDHPMLQPSVDLMPP